jgi:hypothetical protein
MFDVSAFIDNTFIRFYFLIDLCHAHSLFTQVVRLSSTMNEYNQVEGPPIVRVGNWAEESVLLETTGFTRQRGGKMTGTDDTALRCFVNKDIENDWTTTSNPPGSVTYNKYYNNYTGKGKHSICKNQIY